jgi:hypothetical protein
METPTQRQAFNLKSIVGCWGWVQNLLLGYGRVWILQASGGRNYLTGEVIMLENGTGMWTHYDAMSSHKEKCYLTCEPSSYFEYSEPSLIRLQLIRVEIRKNSVHSLVHTWRDTRDLGARGIRATELSDCEGWWRDWNHARKYPRLVWGGWRRPWISVSYVFVVSK